MPVKKVSEFGKFSGLMFKGKNTENLLFEFRNWKTAGIHSFFVFFSFAAVWLDKKNNVVDFEVVRPFRFLVNSKKPSTKLVELPINYENREIIEFLVGKGKI